jgi:hypothetical protein
MTFEHHSGVVSHFMPSHACECIITIRGEMPPYPSYSPDMVPSDFDLFGKRNGALIGRDIPDAIGLLEVVTDILDGFGGQELQAVFPRWTEHMQKVIDAHGNDFSWSTFWVHNCR